MLLLSGLSRLGHALIELRDELRDCTARDAFSQSSGQSAVLEPAAVLQRVCFLGVFWPLPSLNDLASPVTLWNLDSLLSHPRHGLDRRVSEAVMSCPPTSRSLSLSLSLSADPRYVPRRISAAPCLDVVPTTYCSQRDCQEQNVSACRDCRTSCQPRLHVQRHPSYVNIPHDVCLQPTDQSPSSSHRSRSISAGDETLDLDATSFKRPMQFRCPGRHLDVNTVAFIFLDIVSRERRCS